MVWLVNERREGGRVKEEGILISGVLYYEGPYNEPAPIYV